MDDLDQWYPPEHPPMPTGPEHFPSSGLNSLATFWPRAAARVLDSLLIGVPVLVIVAVVSYSASSADTGVPRWGSALWFVLAVAYETSLVAWRGQTLGKMALGIKVARLDNGRPPLWWQAAIRICLPAATAAFPFDIAIIVYPTVFLTAGFDPIRRGIHDRAGGTVVVVAR